MPGPEFHLFLPQMRMDLETLVSKAMCAEANGFDGLALMDHLAPPGAEQHDMWEAMTAATWLLSRTETLKVGHLVLCDSMRHPAVLARQAVTLDHASGGRFEIGIGWGSVPSELAAFGVGSTDARSRVERLTETLDILRALWTGEPVDYDGKNFNLSGAQQRPVPTNPIPLIIGGTGRRTLQLVADHADWWNLPVYGLNRLDELRSQIGRARVSAQQMVAYVGDQSSRREVRDVADKRFGSTVMNETMAFGDAQELADHFCALHGRGVERFYVWFTDFAASRTIEGFGQEVISAVRAQATAPVPGEPGP